MIADHRRIVPHSIAIETYPIILLVDPTIVCCYAHFLQTTREFNENNSVWIWKRCNASGICQVRLAQPTYRTQAEFEVHTTLANRSELFNK